MKVLVTGATGFLGSWTVRKLASEGLQVRILCRPTSDLSELAGSAIEKCYGDITDLESLKKAVTGVDSVFHLAGLIAYNRTQRAAMEAVNVKGTSNVIEACLSQSVRRVIHLSSVVTIGASFDGKIPLNENSSYNLAHLDLGYFETKRKAENLVLQAVRAKNLDAVILNPSTIYGAGDLKKGSRGVQLKVIKGQMPFYTSGGVSIIGVEEVVDSLFVAWQKGKSGERYILSGENITIQKLFELIAKEAKVPPPKFFLPNSLVKSLGSLGNVTEKLGLSIGLNSENAWTSILFHWYDSSKAQRELGLKPQPAQEAIAKSVKWFLKTQT